MLITQDYLGQVRDGSPPRGKTAYNLGLPGTGERWALDIGMDPPRPQVSARGRAMLSLREQALSAPSGPHLLSILYNVC